MAYDHALYKTIKSLPTGELLTYMLDQYVPPVVMNSTRTYTAHEQSAEYQVACEELSRRIPVSSPQPETE